MLLCAAVPTAAFGCAADRPGGEDCTSSADCAPSFTCIDGLCERGEPARTLDGRPSDSGSPFVLDAGSTDRDAGPAALDAAAPGVDATVPTTDAAAGNDAHVARDAAGICGPAACPASGAKCGPVVDGCSILVDCGGCQSGFECGPRGSPFENRCRCKALSEQEACRNRCGDVDNGCGVTIRCGGCGSNETCRNNRCECVPRTCSDVGAQCGDIDTGCGYTRNCGGCNAPQRCGGGGTANRCGCQNETEVTGWQTFARAQNINNLGRPWDDLAQCFRQDNTGCHVTLDGSECRLFERVSDDLYFSDASLGIPAGATVTGIELQANFRRAFGALQTLSELVLVGPGASFQSRSAPRQTLNQVVDQYETFNFGGRTDRWGLSASQLTPAALNQSGFGVRLRVEVACRSSTSRANIDFARVRVHYTQCL